MDVVSFFSDMWKGWRRCEVVGWGVSGDGGGGEVGVWERRCVGTLVKHTQEVRGELWEADSSSTMWASF